MLNGNQVDELRQIFSAAPLSPHDVVAASASVRNAYLKATGAATSEDAEEGNTDAGSKDETFAGRRLASVGDDCPV